MANQTVEKTEMDHHAVAADLIRRLQELRDLKFFWYTPSMRPEAIAENLAEEFKKHGIRVRERIFEPGIFERPPQPDDRLLLQLQDFLKRRWEVQYQQDCLATFERVTKDLEHRVASEFIRLHFPSASGAEARWIEDRIIRERDDDWLGIGQSLTDLVAGGAKRVCAIRRRERLRKSLSVAWAILVNSLSVCVALYLYSALGSDFEVLVVSLLLLIYVALASRASLLGLAFISGILQAVHLHENIRQLLGSSLSLYEKQEVRKAEKQNKKVWVDAMISNVGNGLISAIALWHIVKVAWGRF
jgi:hypothetical protein